LLFLVCVANRSGLFRLPNFAYNGLKQKTQPLRRAINDIINRNITDAKASKQAFGIKKLT
jgi:hypothetical protein